MTVKPLNERLQNDEANVIDRRRISQESEEHLAEALHHGDYEEFAKMAFEIMTGDLYTDFTPSRDVELTIEATDAVITELDGKRVEVAIVFNEDERSYSINADRQSFGATWTDNPDGSYGISASVESVYEYAEDGIERTEYNFSSDNVILSESTVTVDTKSSEFGATITGPTVTVDDLTVGDVIEK